MLSFVWPNHFITPQMFGAVAGSASVQDAAFTRACRAAIEDGLPLVVEGEFTLDVIDLSSVSAGGNLCIRHHGNLIHVDAASGDMFDFGTRDYVEITGPGEFDGQYDEQSTKRLIMPVASVSRFYLAGSTFRDVSRGAVHQQSPSCESFIMERFSVLDGAVHTGVASGGTEFVLLRAGKYNRISDFRMVQTADPAAGENRNPAGVFYVNTGSGAPSRQTIIERGYLENLGHSSAGNHAAAIDFYSKCENIVMRDNILRKPRWLPIRTNYANKINVAGNDIEVPGQIYLNDTTAYTEAAGISIGLVDRGYDTDEGNLEQATVERNRVAISGNHNCRGISINNGDADYLIESAVVAENRLSHSGTNSYYGLYAVAVADLADADNEISGFGMQRRVQGGAGGSATAALGTINYSVSGGSSVGGTVGLYSRDNNANLDVTVGGHLFSGQSSLTYTVRNAKNVRIAGNTMPAPGDTSSNDAFWFRDNEAGGSADPVGYTTNAFYRLRDNRGRPDQASA